MSINVDYSKFRDPLRFNQCALVIGPSLVTGIGSDGLERPLMDLCAYEISAELLKSGYSLTDAERYDLFHVANLFKERDKNTMLLQLGVHQFYRNQHYINPTLQLLAELPFKIIINTTPDQLFLQALQGRSYQFEYYDFKRMSSGGASENINMKRASAIEFDPDGDERLVYNLFGCFGNKTPDGRFKNSADSLPLTGADQIEYIKKVTAEETKNMIALINGWKSYHYFFMGFDFSSWYARILMSVLNIKKASALEGRIEPANPTGVFFHNEFTIDFLPVDIREFTKQLYETFNTVAEDAPAAAPSETEVLVLHNDSDVEDNRRLQRLKQFLSPIEGVSWWDMTQIMPDENRDQVVADKIQNSRYIILLLSPSTISDTFFYTIIPKIWERKQKGCLVWPVVMSSCAWEANPFLSQLRDFIRPRGAAIDMVPNQESALLTEFALEVKQTLDRTARAQ